MILDGHIHIRQGDETPASFREKLDKAGVAGGSIISLPPASFAGFRAETAQHRLDNLFDWIAGQPNLFPFFWIDPTESGALDQVTLALERGVSGFKVICSRHDPGDERAMPVYRAIAKAGRPILFHSGILWDARPSSTHCRPAGFEALLEVDGLRFCLAHISWPWTDECIAVYGKFLSSLSRRPGLSVEMFIDVTPGTPPIYRRDALTRLLTVGYDVERNVIFGSDCHTDGYNHEWVRAWVERDNAIYKDLGLKQATLEGIYGGNLRRFIGLADNDVKHRALVPGE